MRVSRITPTLVLLVLGVAIIAILFWQRINIMGLVQLATRGKKVSNAQADATGRVTLSPAELVAQVSQNLGRPVTGDAVALAKMLASEGYRDTPLKRSARAWVAFNDLAELRRRFGWRDFTRLFTFSTQRNQLGFFGNQEKGRRYATHADIYEGHILDAETLIASFAAGNDPTNGATKFIDEKALGKQPGTEGKTLASIEAAWGLKGRRLDNSDFYIFGGKSA